MSDVERLEAELKLAKLSEKLEEAREAMHADRTPENIAAYQKWSNKVAAARSEYRTKHRPGAPVGPGDGVASVETVEAAIGVERP